MSVNSSLLFLLTHETQRREREIAEELERSYGSCGAVVEAGCLTVRRKVADDTFSDGRATDYVHMLVNEHESVSLRLLADLAKAERAEIRIPDKPLGFVQHALQCSVASAAVLCGLCVLGGVLALCSFIIGVALPFHLS